MRDLVELLVRALVDDPDAVRVEEIDEERARHWLDHGAQPSQTVATLLRKKGIEATGR